MKENLKNTLGAKLYVHLMAKNIRPIIMMILTLIINLLMISCSDGSSAKQQNETETPEIQTEQVNEQQDFEENTAEIEQSMEIKKEPTNWLTGDFKIEYDWYPYVAMNAVAGTNDNTNAHYKIVKTRDKVLYYGTVNGAETFSLFCFENGKLFCYDFNPYKKKAVKKSTKYETLEELVVTLKAFTEIYTNPKKFDELTKAGTEEIAGIKCAVYKNTADKANERLEKAKKEADGWAALSKALGNQDTKDIEAMKAQLSGIDGVTTYWIDPTKNKFIARKHIYLNMNGKITDADSHVVTLFQEGNIDDSEIPYNMSEYEL